jgi:hypothetical protein
MRTMNSLLAVGVFLLGAACGDDTASGGGGGGGGTAGNPGSGGDPSAGAPGTGGDGGTTTDGGAPGTGGEGGLPGTGGMVGQGGAPDPPTPAECTAGCQAAVDAQCAPIGCECSDFCDAALSVEDCSDEEGFYFECAGAQANPCDAETACADEQQALTDCITNYCLANLSAPECQTLIGCQ